MGEGGGAHLLLLLLLVASSHFDRALSSPEIRILDAERRIDLTSFIIREYLTLKVENIGTSPASDILLAFPPSQAEHIALLRASLAEGKRKKKTYFPLSVNPTESSNAPNGAMLFSISLLNPLKSGESTLLEVLAVLTHVLEPFPEEISQSESQLVLFRDSAFMLSPYNIKEQITYIRMPSAKVESYMKVDSTNRVGTELRYGHYNGNTPYSYAPILVHFENNNPFAVIEDLVREVEISHWGNVKVTEHYMLVHGGARHKGGFSRVEYQSRAFASGVASFKNLLARLPPRVHSVYYRDGIGNISSSHLRVDHHKSELEFEPRYPLFGGWKSSFIIGYSLPLQDFLFESTDGRWYLNFSFGSPIVETVVDKFTLKVLLPEGSTDPSVAIPFPVEQLLETSYSYLDVIGRKTVVLKKENVVPEHNLHFQVYYGFKPIFMLAEPLMLFTAFLLFFVACIAYLHTDLSIRKV